MTIQNLILLLIINTLFISFLIKIYNLVCNYNYKEYFVLQNLSIIIDNSFYDYNIITNYELSMLIFYI